MPSSTTQTLHTVIKTKSVIEKHRELFESVNLEIAQSLKFSEDDKPTRIKKRPRKQGPLSLVDEMKELINSAKSVDPRLFYHLHSIIYLDDVSKAELTVSSSRDDLKKLFEKYKNPLALKYEQLIFKDDYGDLDESLVLKEYQAFLSRKCANLIYVSKIKFSYKGGMSTDNWTLDDAKGKQFLEVLTNKEKQDFLNNSVNSLLRLVKTYRSSPAYKKEHKADISFENLSPLEYEKQVAQSLEKLGWNTRVTKGSGDQGCDVLATKNNKTVAIQCKYYSKPIGNKAVQEISAGRSFYNAQYGAVVTNQSFTPSAKILATKLHIELLHHTQVNQLDKLVKS